MRLTHGLLVLSLAFALPACGADHDHPHPHPHDGDEPAEPLDVGAEEEGHEHAEEPLGSVEIGGMAVELAQGHGAIAAGKEGHLVVKLPYDDDGQTIVRAWIGTEDRMASMVGRGEYAPSHDDYDVHATAPDPLPDGAQWWIEIEKPDGTKVVGSAKPMVE